MKILLAVEVPDDVLKAEWQGAVDEGQTTKTLAEWRGEQPDAVLDYLSGWFTDATVAVVGNDLIADIQDEHGRVHIPFDETQNRPGKLEVDGDLYGSGPVVFLTSYFTSEQGGYLETLHNEIDFGTFQVTVQGPAKMRAHIALMREQAEALIAAIQWQLQRGDDGAWEALRARQPRVAGAANSQPRGPQ